MTRKDYVAIAAAIMAGTAKARSSIKPRMTRDEVAVHTSELIATAIGNVMAAQNRNFDEDRWFEATTTLFDDAAAGKRVRS